MSKFEIVMPKLGESVEEATITKWFIKEGDTVEEEDALLEIATDKVDSEIPSPVDGVVAEVRYKVDDVVPVGEVIAIIDMSGEEPEKEPRVAGNAKETNEDNSTTVEESKPKTSIESEGRELGKSDKFYSPLVRSIAKSEGISIEELDKIQGSGHQGRVKKEDILNYIETQGKAVPNASQEVAKDQQAPKKSPQKASVSVSAEDEIVEMDRMRKIIAEHMINSVQTSPHVTNMVEADVTNIVQWRGKVKDVFQNREKEKLTYLPLFLEAAIKAIKDFPRINASVDGDRIIIKKRINLGIAVALDNGNLIVPVIKNADQKNTLGLAKEINRLAKAARENKLSPDEIQDGTFSVTNFGSFKNVMGTPIINQPQVAILATGTIEKKPAVVETPSGDVIAIRHKMFLSLSYDHRVVDGALGGAYLKRVADYLESFDVNTTV